MPSLTTIIDVSEADVQLEDFGEYSKWFQK